MNTGTRIKGIREHLHMTQEQFAKHVGIRREEVSRLESNVLKATSINVLRKFAQAFGVTLDKMDRVLHGNESLFDKNEEDQPRQAA